MTGSQMLGGCPLGWETKFHLGGMVVFCYACVESLIYGLVSLCLKHRG